MNVQQSSSRYLLSKPYLSHNTKLKRKTLIQSNKLLNFNHKTKHELSSSIIENKSIGKSNPQSFRSLEINNKNRSIDSEHFAQNKGLRRLCVRQAGKGKEKQKEKDIELRLGIHPNWKSIQGNQSRSIEEKSRRFGVEQVKSCRYKPKLMKKTKVVSSARELNYYNQNISSLESIICQKESNKADNLQNTCQYEKNHQTDKTGQRTTKTRQKRRYLTQISDKQASSMTLIKKQVTQKQKQNTRQQTRQKIQKKQHKQNVISNANVNAHVNANNNTNTNTNININEISSILDQTKYNHCTRDQQKSILDNIGYLDMLLDHFCCPKPTTDGFQGAKVKQSRNIQIQHNISQIHEVNNKQNIQTWNNHQQIPNTQPQPHVYQQQQQQTGQMNKLSVYKLKHRNGKKDRIKQIKSNTLIMRSIGKIKHIFPQGFFYDSLATLE